MEKTQNIQTKENPVQSTAENACTHPGWFPWILMSKYRAQLMGLAMLGVFATHYRKSFTIRKLVPPAYLDILSFGTAGVDLFLILSGLGLYYSFYKDSRIPRFYYRRVIRILPAYIIAQAVHAVVSIFMYSPVDWKNFLIKASLINYPLKGDAAFWFVFAILFCYLIFPLLYYALRMTKNDILNLAICLAVYLVIHQLLVHYSYPFYKNVATLIQRLPAFIFGVWVGKQCHEKKYWPPVLLVISWAVTLLFVFRKELPFMPKFRINIACFVLSLVALSVSLSLVVIWKKTEKLAINRKIIFPSLGFLGQITLEGYLFHSLFKLYFYSPTNPLLYILTSCVLPVIAAWIVHQICLKILKYTDR